MDSVAITRARTDNANQMAGLASENCCCDEVADTFTASLGCDLASVPIGFLAQSWIQAYRHGRISQLSCVFSGFCDRHVPWRMALQSAVISICALEAQEGQSAG